MRKHRASAVVRDGRTSEKPEHLKRILKLNIKYSIIEKRKMATTLKIKI